ncbi:MAG: Ig-like domain-containing protein, partial [Bacteroidota bacterium]
MMKLLFLSLLLSLFSFALIAQKPPRISLECSEGCFLVAPIDTSLIPKNRQWGDLFKVFTGEEALQNPDYPALLGSYELGQDFLKFHPRFPLQSGITYYAEWNQAIYSRKNSPQKIRASFFLPKKTAKPSTYVERIFPSSDTLPENQLKLYIHFSAPMRPGQGLKFIQILDEQGQDIAPFLPLPEELWDQEQKRLTVLFDPGRIKRGLVPHLESGKPLQEQHKYQIWIKSDFKDQRGRPLVADFRKDFYTTKADRISPSPEAWRLEIPLPGTKEPLKIKFEEALDAALALRSIQIMQEDRTEIRGQIHLANQEKEWIFQPYRPWLSGTYTLKINPRLEDLAGNNLHKLFDTDLRFQNSPIGRTRPDFIFRTF